MLREQKHWISIITVSFLLAACGGAGPPENVQDKEVKISMTPTRTLDLSVNDPAEFLPFIHQAIRLDSLELIQLICHPDPSRVRNDQTRAFCNIAVEGSDKINDFKRWYKNATVQGDIWAKGDTAWIPTKLADGEKYSLLVLERSKGQWYLVLMGISD